MFLQSNNDKDKEIFDLLMTDGEIDLEKILCIHAFSITTAPSNCRRIGPNHSSSGLTPYSLVLPSIIAFNKDEDEFLCTCWKKENNDEVNKLYTVHLAVNECLIRLILAALELMQEQFPEKLKKISEYGRNINVIQTILQRKKNAIFIKTLYQTGKLNCLNELRTEKCLVIPSANGIIQKTNTHIRNPVFFFKLPKSLQLKRTYISLNNILIPIIKYTGVKLFTDENHGAGSTKNPIDKSFIHLGIQSKGRQYRSQCRKNKTITCLQLMINRWPFEKKLLNIDKELELVRRFNNKYLKHAMFLNNDEYNNKLPKTFGGQSDNDLFRQTRTIVTHRKEKHSKERHFFPKIMPRIPTPKRVNGNVMIHSAKNGKVENGHNLKTYFHSETNTRNNMKANGKENSEFLFKTTKKADHACDWTYCVHDTQKGVLDERKRIPKLSIFENTTKLKTKLGNCDYDQKLRQLYAITIQRLNCVDKIKEFKNEHG